MTANTKNSNKGDIATGPLKFASVMLSIAGVLSIIDGIAAVAGDDRFNATKLFFNSLTAWGIAYIVVGLLQLYAANEIRLRKARGLLLGVTFASLSGIVHFMSIGAYPIWSITVMVIDFAVLFALLTNDDAF
ncbi:MAG: hypothetical protein QM648_03260 [Solirubrobacterales bacterium]